MRRAIRLTAGLALAGALCTGENLIVSNPAGDVEFVVTPGMRLTVGGTTPQGPAGEDDFAIVRQGDDIRVEVSRRDGPLDLAIQAPLGLALDATTQEGNISVEGMVHRVRLRTDTGAIRLLAPLRGIRLRLDAEVKPPAFDNPSRRLFSASRISRGVGSEISEARRKRSWRLEDRLPKQAISYGDYWVTARAPRSVELSEFHAPNGWPLRFPWEARQELLKTLEPPSAGERLPPIGASRLAPLGTGEDLVFRSDVRLVNLTVSVSDADGNPAEGLTAERFRVREDGVLQQVGPLASGEAAFNLALVLDMSGSAELHREPIQAAARRFVDMARPGDRVAIYALTFGMFQVISPLSSDREDLLAAVDQLPGIVGPSPLYDVVTLAYAHELRQLPGERNAVIFISDGLDNRVTGGLGPSEVRFRDLSRMAEEMHAIIYPVFLEGEPDTAADIARGRPAVSAREARRKEENVRRSRERLQELAQATGGRLFPATSIADLAPVFPQVEAELRSVYSLGYYPADQNFDGDWRTINVSVDQPGLRVRARPGYYAK